MTELSPAELTSQINEAAKIQELLCIHSRHESCLDATHISDFWISIGKLANQAPLERSWLQGDAQAFDPLVKQTVTGFSSRLLFYICLGSVLDQIYDWVIII